MPRTQLVKRFGRPLFEIIAALAIVAACVLVYRFAMMPLLGWALPLSDLQSTVLRRIGVTASAVVGYWLAVRFVERRRCSDLAVKPAAIALGAVSGAALIGITLLTLYSVGSYQLLSYRGFFAALPVLAMIGFAAILEEVIFRGIVFRIFEPQAGTMPALIAQSTLFGCLHLFNDSTTLMTVLSVTLLGAFWTLVYVHSRNLWAVVANHAAWNAMIFASGVPLSGQEDWRAAALFDTSVQGPAWLTGGGFGPEDSIINIVLMTTVVLGYARWIRRRSASARVWNAERRVP